jgi:hypothetical protein
MFRIYLPSFNSGDYCSETMSFHGADLFRFRRRGRRSSITGSSLGGCSPIPLAPIQEEDQ